MGEEEERETGIRYAVSENTGGGEKGPSLWPTKWSIPPSTRSVVERV